MQQCPAAAPRYGCLQGDRLTPVSASLSELTFVEELAMFSWAVVFLMIALVAALFGFSGLAGTPVNIAWILFVVGLTLALVFLVRGCRSPSLYNGQVLRRVGS